MITNGEYHFKQYIKTKRRNLTMRNATVKWFNAQKGYGFLTDSEIKEDVFCHYLQLQMDGFKTLHENDMVEYEIGSGAGKDSREQAINVKPILTMKMIEDSLKEDNLYIETMKDGYGVTKYQVVDGNNVLQTDENGMSFLDLAAFAGFSISEEE